MEEPQIGAPLPNDESPAQKQARLRRERRGAKIKAGGSARLDKITQISGRPAEHQSADLVSEPKAPPITTQNPALASPSDPDEADISDHVRPSQPSSRNRAPTEADIRQLLRSTPPPHAGPGQQQASGEEDPMVRILQQMMGAMPGTEGNQQNGLPPGLAALLGDGGGGGAAGPGQAQNGQGNDGSAYFWKIVHAIFAFMLGIYIVAVTTFDGAQFSRSEKMLESGEGRGGEGVGKRLFWIFATAEVVLQSSRFFLERGTTDQSGWMGMLTQVLPEPWKSYAGLLTGYSGIWTTTVQDAMVVVFVLGVVAWWNGVVS
ncbi:MAG: hypothetical protein Q9181_000592 [Wetmoreana brouardii]